MKYIIALLATFFMCGVSYGCTDFHPCDGIDGSDGINGSNGTNGRDGINGSLFSDNSLTRAISINAALSNIPALSHVDNHTHSGFGAAVGNYSNQSSVAVGFVHQRGKMAYKASYGVSGTERILGAGISRTW